MPEMPVSASAVHSCTVAQSTSAELHSAQLRTAQLDKLLLISASEKLHLAWGKLHNLSGISCNE